MRLLLMRHAQCYGNVERRMLGSQDGPAVARSAAGSITRLITKTEASAAEVLASRSTADANPQHHSLSELTELGLHQAQALGRWLSGRATAPTHLYSSPLRRVCQTWQQVQQHCPEAAALNVVSDRRLIEMDQGIFTGLTWPEARQNYPERCRTLEQSVDWQPVPGAESPADCRKRAHALWADWQALHSNEDCLWIISHGGFLVHLVSELLGCDRTWGYAIASTAVFELELDLPRWYQDQDNRFNTALWKINHFNSTEHLAEIAST